jgi:alpha-L-fucosidase
VQKKGTVYATIMAWPQASEFIFRTVTPDIARVQSVRLLGYGNVSFTQGADGLKVSIPSTHPNEIAPVFALNVGR